MWNVPSQDRLSRIPKLYETEALPLKDKIIHLHFFLGGCDWYVAEYDGEDLFWGYAILNADFENAEWGYMSLEEMKAIRTPHGLEIDCETEHAWILKRAGEIGKIAESGGVT